MFERIAGQMVHTVTYGQGADTIVGLAGVFGNVEIWQQPFELLHHRFRTIAFDHFGTGETHVTDRLVTFDEQVALIEHVLDAFDVERCVLAGDSSFSAVAIAAAARWPERVRALALVAGRIDHQPNEDTLRFVEGLRRSFDRTVAGFVDVCLPEDVHGHLRRWLRDIISRTGPDRAARLVESFYDVEIRALLPSLDVPTLVVHGALDRINAVAAAEELAEELPDSELIVLGDAGHVPTLSRPTAVADAISDFVRRRT
jgi:3-oxoadipate enol-lactonase / 4-carboxymuconolactone decarboxylase